MFGRNEPPRLFKEPSFDFGIDKSKNPIANMFPTLDGPEKENKDQYR